MSSEVYQSIRTNPRFQELVRKRGRFAWTLSAIVLTVFYGFVMVVAFKPALLAVPVSEGGALTVGVAAGLVMFTSFWFLTALYVRRANGEFDSITEKLLDDAKKEQIAAALKRTAAGLLLLVLPAIGSAAGPAMEGVAEKQPLNVHAIGMFLVFVLSLGYYITPALLGGAGDEMISQLVALQMDRQLNWGLAGALSVYLVIFTLAVYAVFNRLVGIDRLRLG